MKKREIITLVVESDEGVEYAIQSTPHPDERHASILLRGDNVRLIGEAHIEPDTDPSIAKDSLEDNLPHDLTHHKDCGCTECEPCKLCKLRGYEHSLCPECNPCEMGITKTVRELQEAGHGTISERLSDPAFMSKDKHSDGLTIEEKLVKNTADVMDAIQDVMEKKPEKPKESNLTFYADLRIRKL